MLESATIRRPGLVDGDYDVGRILETLLYYRRVHLVLDLQAFSGIAMQLGLHRLKQLLSRDDVTVSFLPEGPGVQSTNQGVFQVHRPIIFKMLGTDPNDERPIKLIFNSIHRQKGFENLKIKDLLPIVQLGKISSYKNHLGGEALMNSLFASLATDKETLRLALAEKARRSGRDISQNLLNNLDIEAHDFDGEILVSSNVQPSALVGDEGFTWAKVLTSIQDYSIDTLFAQKNSTDLIGVTDIPSLGHRRIDLSLKRAQYSRQNVEAFQTVVLEGCGGLAQAYNQQQISFENALRLIDRSDRFRDWLVGLAPDAELLLEYNKALAKEGIFDKLPAVTARFALFAAAGVGLDGAGTGRLGTMAALSLSAFDALVLDRILKGWRPNVFVETMRKALLPK